MISDLSHYTEYLCSLCDLCWSSLYSRTLPWYSSRLPLYRYYSMSVLGSCFLVLSIFHQLCWDLSGLEAMSAQRSGVSILFGVHVKPRTRLQGCWCVLSGCGHDDCTPTLGKPCFLDTFLFAPSLTPPPFRDCVLYSRKWCNMHPDLINPQRKGVIIISLPPIMANWTVVSERETRQPSAYQP